MKKLIIGISGSGLPVALGAASIDSGRQAWALCGEGELINNCDDPQFKSDWDMASVESFS